MLLNLGKTILLEPNLDSLLMPSFSHCLQKYSVYHSLRCVFLYSLQVLQRWRPTAEPSDS